MVSARTKISSARSRASLARNRSRSVIVGIGDPPQPRKNNYITSWGSWPRQRHFFGRGVTFLPRLCGVLIFIGFAFLRSGYALSLVPGVLFEPLRQLLVARRD